MHKHLNLNRNILAFAVPLILFSILILLIKSSLMAGNDTLDLAISADLLLTVPLLYFLIIRKTEIPKTTVVPVMIIGLLIGLNLLPVESQTYVLLFKTWALPIIEISIITYVIIKVRYAIKKYKTLKGVSPDFFSALKSTCSEILPKKLVTPFATEVAVFYYGFFNWRKKTYEDNEFTNHKNSGTPALLGGLVLVLAIEAFVLHILVAGWSIIAAWILSALSIYTAIQIIGFARAFAARPISINQDSLSLKYSLLNEVTIPINAIESIELSKKEMDKDPLTKKLSPLGELESHNMIIRLKEEHQLTGLYGMKKNFKVLGLYVDEAERFKNELRKVLIEN